MPIEEKVKRVAPRFEGTVSREGTGVVATLGAPTNRDEVLLQRGKGRSILHVPTEEWAEFRALVDEIDEALKRKHAIEHPELDLSLQVPVAPPAIDIVAPAGSPEEVVEQVRDLAKRSLGA